MECVDFKKEEITMYVTMTQMKIGLKQRKKTSTMPSWEMWQK